MSTRDAEHSAWLHQLGLLPTPPIPGAERGGASGEPGGLLAALQREQFCQQARTRHFSSEVAHTRAWELLVAIAWNSAANAPLMSPELFRQVRVAPSGGMRWLMVLEANGLIQADRSFASGDRLRLTRCGEQKMRAYAAEILPGT